MKRSLKCSVDIGLFCRVSKKMTKKKKHEELNYNARLTSSIIIALCNALLLDQAHIQTKKQKKTKKTYTQKVLCSNSIKGVEN